MGRAVGMLFAGGQWRHVDVDWGGRVGQVEVGFATGLVER